MGRKKNPVTIFFEGFKNMLFSDQLKKDQSLLLLELSLGKISLTNYFKKQEKNNKQTLEEAKDIDWGRLKKEDKGSYLHEKAHSDVWKKYGIKTTLHKRGIEFFVIGRDFEKVSKEKKFDRSKIVEILKEVLTAPWEKVERDMNRCSTDLFYFEILDGKIRSLEGKAFKKDFKETFYKYKPEIKKLIKLIKQNRKSEKASA